MDAAQVVAVLQGISEAPPTKFVSCKQPLDQTALAEIASALSRKSHAGVKGLRLEGCTIGDLGARLLADALSSNTELQTLELPNNFIGSEGAAAFGQVLQYQNCVLKVLDLTGNPCQFTAASVIQEIEKSLHRNRVIKRAADRRVLPGPSSPAISTAVVASTPPSTGRKLSYWASPSGNQQDERLEIEQRLQRLEDNYGMLQSEIEHIKRAGSNLESWSKQVEAASTQVAAVLNLVDSTSKETFQRIVALEAWKAAADSASHQVSKVLQKLNEDIKYVDGRLTHLEAETNGDVTPSSFLGPTIIELVEEPPPSERASCSKIKPPPLLCPSATDVASDAQPGPSTLPGICNAAGCTGNSTPAVIPSTPRSMHSSLSDLRVPSPSRTPTHLSPVTWHDNATAMAASLEGLNLRNRTSTPSATSVPSVPDNGEASPTPEPEPSEEILPGCQRDLELRLQEQQVLTEKLAARLEHLERLLSNTTVLPSAPVITVNCSVQTVPQFHWLDQEEDPHCSVSATTIANNHLHCRSAVSVLGASADTAGPSSKMLANHSPAAFGQQQTIHTSVQLAPHTQNMAPLTQYTTPSKQHDMPLKEQLAYDDEATCPKEADILIMSTPQQSETGSNHLAHSLNSIISTHATPDNPASPTQVEPADITSGPAAALSEAPTAPSSPTSLRNSQEFVPSLGSPRTPAQPVATRPPVNPALWLSSSTMLTPGSEASDSDMYQNLLRFVDGLNPNPMGIDLAEKLALLARASQALSQREDLEQVRDQHSTLSAAPPGITPRSSTQSIPTIDIPPSASMCVSPAGRSPPTAATGGVMPFPLHFNAMSASYESSGLDERHPSSCRSSPFRPKLVQQTAPGLAASTAVTAAPTVEKSSMPTAGSVVASTATTTLATMLASRPFTPLASADDNPAIFSCEWPSSSELQPLLQNNGQWPTSQMCTPTAGLGPFDPADDDLSSLVRDVINQVDQNMSRSHVKANEVGLVASPGEDLHAHHLARGASAQPITPGADHSAGASNANALSSQVYSPATPQITDSPNLDAGKGSLDFLLVQRNAGKTDSAGLQDSFPSPVADIGGSANLELPDGKRKPTTLPALPETRELPVDVSRALPIPPTPPTPPNSAANFLPTLFNVPAETTPASLCPASAQAHTARSMATQPLQQSGSNDGSLLLGSVSVSGPHAIHADANPALTAEASAPTVMSRVARVTSRPIPVNETLKASDEMPQGHLQQAKAGCSSVASVPSTPTSSASSTPRPAGVPSNRQSRARSAGTSTTPTPRNSGGHLRTTPKPGEISATGILKTPKSEARAMAGAAAQAQPFGSDIKSSGAKSNSTPFRDASMQRFLLRRGIGKKGANGSPTAANSSGTYSGGSKLTPEQQGRFGKSAAGFEQNMDMDAKGLIPAGQGRKKFIGRAVNALTRPFKTLMGTNALDMPLRMHSTRSRRKSSMCPETSSNDASLMLAPRALSENTAVYYRYTDTNESADMSSSSGLSLVRRMMSETAAGQLHSYRYK